MAGDARYVVINHEEQYSVWPADRQLPPGWRPTGRPGTRQACLDHIEEVWTDLRPPSVRRKVEELERQLLHQAGRR